MNDDVLKSIGKMYGSKEEEAEENERGDDGYEADVSKEVV